MPVNPIAAAMPAMPSLPVSPTGAGTGRAGAVAGSGQEFGNKFAQALDDLQGAHDKADNLAVRAATGDVQDAHDYMIAATEASLATEMTTAVRNRAVEAFTSIMQMQV